MSNEKSNYSILVRICFSSRCSPKFSFDEKERLGTLTISKDGNDVMVFKASSPAGEEEIKEIMSLDALSWFFIFGVHYQQIKNKENGQP
jgi:hypothetical protein